MPWVLHLLLSCLIPSSSFYLPSVIKCVSHVHLGGVKVPLEFSEIRDLLLLLAHVNCARHPQSTSNKAQGNKTRGGEHRIDPFKRQFLKGLTCLVNLHNHQNTREYRYFVLLSTVLDFQILNNTITPNSQTLFHKHTSIN